MVIAAALVSLAAAGSLRATRSTTAQASVTGPAIEVRGKPFFPVMLIDQCTSAEAGRARRLGINLIVNESCPRLSSRRQLSLVGAHSLAVLSIARPLVRGGALAGWTFPDEPEDNGWTPARLKRAHPYLRGSKDGLLTFLTTGGGFFAASYARSKVPQATYGRFARLADVAGFDLYPLGHCSADLAAVYDAQRAFGRIVGPQPTFQWIETGPIKPTYCGGFAMQPAELRAEVWLAIAGGARGIGYFTHTWSPKHRALDLRPPIAREIRRMNDLIAALRPALTGRTALSGTDTGTVKVLARQAGGKTFVIAVNSSRSTTNAKLHVPALHPGAVQVFGEKRRVSATDDHFSDTFRPLAVHVYVQ